VRRRADYRRIQASRSRTHTRHFLVVIVPSATQRLGITVTKKIGNAVVRNRVKRVLREVFRRNRALFPPGTDIVFIAKHGAGKLGYAAVLSEVNGIRDSLARQRDRLGPAPEAPSATTEASS
jgi:ribonuclease P protein component